MKWQLVFKMLVALLCAASMYVSIHLLIAYISAITGQLTGAGTAQWQFEFMSAPVAIAIGAVAWVIARWSRPPLHRTIQIVTLSCTLLPCMLLGLVIMHAY